MESVKYYLDLNNGFVLAYEKSTEFFVIYNSEKDEWADCGISFMEFAHDFLFKEISADEAKEKTNANLPTAKHEEYIGIIRKNSSC